MVIDPQQTTVAYRCPHCGGGVMSAVNIFALSADMVKLKCTCGKSEMTVKADGAGKIRMTVPCLVCSKPHTFTLNESLFFGKDLFTLQCPYSADLTLAFFGEINRVKAELARTELELLDMMEQNGIESFDVFHREGEPQLGDPQIREIVMFVIHDMDAEGKIFCKCPPEENDRDYDVAILDDAIRVSCKKCHAEALIPTDSCLGAHAFLNADSLHLE